MKSSSVKGKKRPSPVGLKKPESNFWRNFCNFWTIVLYTLVIADFFKGNALIDLVSPATIIYTGALTIYSAEKEFERWHDYHRGRHPGEIYVIGWTLLVIALFLAEYFSSVSYRLPAEVVAVYVVVLGLLAITKRSKRLYEKK